MHGLAPSSSNRSNINRPAAWKSSKLTKGKNSTIRANVLAHFNNEADATNADLASLGSLRSIDVAGMSLVAPGTSQLKAGANQNTLQPR